MNTPKIAIFTTRSSLVSHPMVYSFLKLLAHDVGQIDLFSENPALKALELPENIKNYYVSFERKQRIRTLFGHKLLQQKWFRYIYYPYLQYLTHRIRYLTHWIRNQRLIMESRKDIRRLIVSDKLIRLIDKAHISYRYDWAVGIGHQGVILAYLSFPEVPLIYFSDEIYYIGHPEFSGCRFLLEKKTEREAFERAALLIIQDEDRAKLLYRDNSKNYNPENVVFFPVSFFGDAKIIRSNLFRCRFPNIGTRKILLQFGSLAPHRRTDKLIEVSRYCPDRYAMVFHGYLANGSIQDKLLKAHCRLSRPDVSLEKLPEVASGADIGLVFYKDNNDNDRLIGHASGQLALFLICGVPVVVNNVGSLGPLVRSWHCGIVVDHEEDIFDAADQIFADYDGFCQRAISCFKVEHDLKKPYQNLLYRLIQISNKRCSDELD